MPSIIPPRERFVRKSPNAACPAALPGGCAGWRSICPANVMWAVLIIAWTVLGCARQTPTSVQASEPPTALPVAEPATIEVTRVVLSERIVEATPLPPHACAPRLLEEAQEIVIALLAPISEPSSLAAALGVQTSLSMAIDEVNDGGGIGGKTVRLWIGDTAGEVDQAAHQAVQSITIGCATAIIASANNGAAHAILEVAHRYGVPLLIVDAPDDDLTASQYPEIFRLAPTNSMLVQTPAMWLEAVGDFNADGKRSALVITDESDAGADHAQWIRDELGRHGFETDAYTVMLPSQDFSSLIARLVVRPVMPDVIFIRISGDDALILQRQLLENGIGPLKQSLIVAARAALDDGRFWATVGPAGTYAVVGRLGPWDSTVDEVGRRFATEYATYLDRWPDAASFAAFDAMHLLADAMMRAPTLTADDLIVALEQSDIQGASGSVRFPFGSKAKPADAGMEPWAWHQWLEPAHMFLQYTEPNQRATEMAIIWPPQVATVAGAVVRPTSP